MPNPFDELMEMARKKGLTVTEKGINLQALGGAKEGRTVAEASGAKETEEEFQKRVIAIAQTHGWRVAHAAKVLVTMGDKHHYETPMRVDGKGFPDLVLVKRKGFPTAKGLPRLLFVELKTDTGTIRPEQKEWLEDLFCAFVEAQVWRPKDLDKITRILKGE